MNNLVKLERFREEQEQTFIGFINEEKLFTLEKLKKYRVEKRFTKKHMTDFLGYKHINSYTNIEEGNVKLSFEVAVKLSVILEIPLHILFFKEID